MKQLTTRSVWAVSLFILIFITAAGAQGVSRSECFPFEELPADQRAAAEELLLKALDDSALYTIVGGLKPMSGGFTSYQMQVAVPRVELADAERIISDLGSKNADDLTGDQKMQLSQAKQAVDRAKAVEDITRAREIMKKWRCGDDLFADIQHFTRAFSGRRYFDAFVISKPRMKRLLTEKADFFTRLGLTPNSHPLAILYTVDSETTNAREGAYGYMFGYPDHAVRFYVQAADEEKFSGKFVEREFISIPTFARPTNSFVYAVPKGYVQTAADKELRDKAEPILAEYRKRRAQYIGEGKKGVVELIRDWFCEGDGNCTAANAKF